MNNQLNNKKHNKEQNFFEIIQYKSKKQKVLKYYEKFFFDSQGNSIFSFKSNFNPKGKKFFIVEMFLYPSGKLHLGHVRCFTITNVIAIYRFMNGYKVFRPFGIDSFGLPAEIAARNKNIKPSVLVNQNIDLMKNILKKLSFIIDWKSEIITSNTDYYCWTQFIFILFYKCKLIYRSKKILPFCSSCKTFLANEQISNNNKCLRCNCLVTNKETFQWFINLPSFSKELYKNLDLLKYWPSKVINSQKQWINYINIGFISHINIDIKKYIHKNKIILNKNKKNNNTVFLFLLIPDKLVYEKHILKEKKILKKYILDIVFKPKNILFLLFINYKFIIKNSILNIKKNFDLWFENLFVTIESSYSTTFQLFKESKKKNKNILNNIQKTKSTFNLFHTKLKPWCISRQIQWGTPMPLFECFKCKKFILIANKKMNFWPCKTYTNISSICDYCGNIIYNVKDTLTTFFDSSWYYWKYFAPSTKYFLPRKILKEWNTVNVYVGGIEHANRHLIYTRFFNIIFKKIGILHKTEPIKKLITQGMVLSKSFFCTKCRLYKHRTLVIKRKNVFYCSKCNTKIVEKIEKISKSKLNYGTDLEKLIDKFGDEALRIFILFLAPIDMDIIWSENGLIGMYKFLKRFNNLFNKEVILSKIEDINFTSIKKRIFLFIKKHYNFYIKKNKLFIVKKLFVLNNIIFLLSRINQNIRQYKFNVSLALIMKVLNIFVLNDFKFNIYFDLLFLYLMYCYPFCYITVDNILITLFNQYKPLMLEKWIDLDQVKKFLPYKFQIINNNLIRGKIIYENFIFLKNNEELLKIFKTKILLSLDAKIINIINKNNFSIIKKEEQKIIFVMIYKK